MAFSFIDEKNIGDAYQESLEKFKPALANIDEFERIARNKPKANLPKGFPPTTDGTTASFIKARPKNVIQQLPTGVVDSFEKDKDLAGVADLVLTERIIPNATSGGSVLQKSWLALSKAATYGSQPAFVFYTQHGDYTGADFKLPYIKDVIMEAGKTFDKDCNVMFMRTYYQPKDIDWLIHREKKLNSEGVFSGWNAKHLSDIKHHLKQKEDETKTPVEKELNLNAGGIEIIFAFQAGKGAYFYGYSPDLKEVLWKMKNPDPRGIIPIHYLYYDLDMSSPIGTGAIEMVAGLQNMLDAEMQMYQYGQALALNPPLIKRGTFDSSTIRFKNNAIWDLGNNPQNSISPANISTHGIVHFTNNYGLIKSQILNINNTSDHSVSAQVGNPGFSKTDSGVKAREQALGVDDNYLRKQFEGWYGDVCETMLNIHFALSSGKEEIELTQEYIDRKKLTDPEFKSTSATVYYDEVKGGFSFKVDASTSKLKDDESAIENLKSVLELVNSDPTLGQYVRKDKILARFMAKVGVDDPEELIVDTDKDGDGNPDPVATPEQLEQMGGGEDV